MFVVDGKLSQVTLPNFPFSRLKIKKERNNKTIIPQCTYERASTALSSDGSERKKRRKGKVREKSLVGTEISMKSVSAEKKC
jgi:hypothetical protein